MVTVYVLYSRDHRRFYRGITNDLTRRLNEHNTGKVYATHRYIPWIVVLVETYDDHQEARNREKYLQSSAGRRFLKLRLDENDPFV